MYDLDDALAIARDAVRAASELLAGATGNIGPVRTKSGVRDLVTEWDTRTEALIREHLHRAAPGVPILGEEAGASGGGDTRRRWLIDPIDGTVNFTHGLPMWGVCVSLEEDDEPVVGVVAAPALGWTFSARRGAGAFVNGEPLRVSTVTELSRAMLATGFPYDRATNPDNNFRQWQHFQRTAGACRRLGAASLDLCLVARGWLDGYWESRLKPWDLSAGAVIVREAGGAVTGIDGGPFRSASGHAVASNGAIHVEILEQLAAVRSEEPR